MPFLELPTTLQRFSSSYASTELENRLLLASNRLPVTIKSRGDGKYDVTASSGGLATGLSGLGDATSFSWYGWTGLELPTEDVPGMTERLEAEHHAIPVWIDDDLSDKHYNGFSS